jgi:membrane protein
MSSSSKELVDLDVQGRLERLGKRWPWFGFVLKVQQRFSELHGTQMSAAVALTAFLTLFPLILVGIAVVGFVAAGADDVPDRIVENLGLTGTAADTVTDAVDKAEQSRRAASVIGLVGLLWTGLGFAGALAYAYNAAWQVKGRGIKDRAFGLAWLVGLGVLVGASFLATGAIEWLGAGVAPLLVLVAIVLDVTIFLWTSWLLPNRRIGIRPLLPAALVGGIALEALTIVGTLIVPRFVADSSALYGTIGVVFAVLAWLLLLGRLVVYVAVLEVVEWERRRGTQHALIDLPALPGSEPVAGTRAGDREEA